LSYTAFQTSVAAASSTMQVQCTSELPYQVSFSSTDPNQRTAQGNLNGLSYTISMPAPPTGGHKGTGASVSHTVDVSKGCGWTPAGAPTGASKPLVFTGWRRA
jgi:hypothetical protein